MFDFTGKTVLVTGGAQGIGKEVVRGVVNGGGHAVILDLNEEKAKATAEELGNCSVYKIDLGDKDNIRAVMAKVLGDFERVDVLINCGGVVSTVPFQEVTDAEWDRTLRINLTGTFTTCSAIYPYFIEKKGGRIVNVSSVAGKIGGGLLGKARQPPFAVLQRQARGFQRPVKRGAQRPVHRPLQVFCRNRRPQRRQAQKDLHPKHKVGRTAAPVLFGPAARCGAGLRRLLPVGVLPHRLFSPLPFSVRLCGKPPYYAPHKRQDPAAGLP